MESTLFCQVRTDQGGNISRCDQIASLEKFVSTRLRTGRISTQKLVQTSSISLQISKGDATVAAKAKKLYLKAFQGEEVAQITMEDTRRIGNQYEM